ncbi:MAG: hypothetical protein IPO32_16665 [Crocinitomicaceae bacterium]|nr:hypothetical protein [Crocinitomicaceae bacterium]
MKKRLLKIVSTLLALILLTEVGLRIFLDNEDRVLYLEDAKCEYRLAPNQAVFRFHNLYQTNEYGMRSVSVKKTQKKRILLFGDSVLNGGTKLDQKEVLSSLLEVKLSEHYGCEIATFNISAGSWGPQNAYNFLQTYIDFEFDAMVLLFSSHDYHDNMHFRKVVGVEPAWPVDQPYLATTDLFTGYLIPKFNSWFGKRYDYLQGFDDSAVNPGWQLFIDYAKIHQKPLIVYHHPKTNEIADKAYVKEGDSLQFLLARNEVDYLSGLNFEKEIDFMDDIHLEASGHIVISDAIFDFILEKNTLLLNSAKE